MAGRKPKPTAMKKLEGNPGKRKLNTKEPVPAKEMPACPEWLMPEAKKEWERLAKLMNQMGVLTEVDMAAFAAYCQSYARWKEAQEHITSGGSTFETDKGYQQQTCEDKCGAYEYDHNCEVCVKDYKLCAYKKPNVTIQINQPDGWHNDKATVTFV